MNIWEKILILGVGLKELNQISKHCFDDVWIS